MRYESAELCKIAINCFLVSSVSTANTLAEICEKSGADWAEIVPALRLDRRIGPHAYLKPGLGIAGGNLERDLVTIQKLAAEYGCDARVVTAWQQNSAYCRDWVLRRLFRLGLLADAAGVVFGMWGLAYKPDTHSTKNSPAVTLLRSLPAHRWQAYDPVAQIEGSEFPCLRLCASPLEAVQDAAALVVMTPWKDFAGVDLQTLRRAMSGDKILDPYGVLDGQRCRELGFDYHQLGA
jgi:UDPglucose 6-dehydrogenase